MGAAGFDAVVLDHDKGPGDLLGAVALLHAVSRAGAHSLVRAPDRAHLRRALQLGVEGVILPNIEAAHEAAALVEACVYPTRQPEPATFEGRVGNQPFRRMDFSFAPPLVEFYGARVAEFARRQGEQVLVAAQLDSAKGAEHAAEIARVDGVDMLFVDASRLTAAQVEHVERVAKSAQKLLG